MQVCLIGPQIFGNDHQELRLCKLLLHSVLAAHFRSAYCNCPDYGFLFFAHF